MFFPTNEIKWTYSVCVKCVKVNPFIHWYKWSKLFNLFFVLNLIFQKWFENKTLLLFGKNAITVSYVEQPNIFTPLFHFSPFLVKNFVTDDNENIMPYIWK